jgi:hypothetical protein
MEVAMTHCVACNREPTLGEMLDDPIVRLLMVRDGVARPDLEKLIDHITIPQGAVKRHITDCSCAPCRE